MPFSPDGSKVIVSYWSENKPFPDFQVVIIDIKTKNKTTVDLDGIEVLNFVSPAIGK